MSRDDQAAFSPPEPSLIQASTKEEPLGPGVSPDTQITSDGMLSKEVNGETLVVPADEVARSVDDAIESGSPERKRKLEKVRSKD
jgi:SIT4-associating protein SAP185/190